MLLRLIPIFLFLSYTSGGHFDEVPASQNVVSGQVAEFMCSHPSADTIRWKVNGSLVSLRSRPVGVSIPFDQNDHILTILGVFEYNSTSVQCIAQFDSGASDQVTTLVFLQVISGFVETPMSFNTTINGAAVFYCQHQSGVVYWRINGQKFKDFPGTSVTHDGGLSILSITGLRRHHNHTSVQCVLRFIFHGVYLGFREESNRVEVLLQGHLSSITNLVRKGSTISWVAPFSLNLTNADPDIVYCVEVYNITCGRSLLITECDVMETNYTNDALHSGYIYEYTVTPRSNVEGASNGTNLTVTEEFIQLNMSAMGPRVTLVTDNSTMAALYLDIISGSESQNSVIPTAYSILLNSLDGLEDNGGFMVNATEDTRSSVTLKLPSLTFRRVWNTTVFACCCEDHLLITNIELGTHDIYNISINSAPLPGVVMVTGDIINGSSSIGALIIVYSLTNDFDVYYNFTLHLSNQLRLHATVMGLPFGQYEVSVFLIEETGLPFRRAAATPRQVQIQGGSNTLPIEYVLVSNSTSVCITCTFLDSSTTDCVAVVHQRISQLSSSGLMSIKSSHKFNRSGDTAHGCIEGVNLTDYQVGVVGGQYNYVTILTGHSTCVGCIIAGAVTVGVLVTVILVVSIFVYKKINRKKKYIVEHICINPRRDPVGDHDERSSSSPMRDHLSANNDPIYEEASPQGPPLPGTPPQGPPLPGTPPQGPPLPGASPQGPTLPGAPPQGPSLPGAPPQGPPLPEASPQGPPLPGTPPQGPPLPGASPQGLTLPGAPPQSPHPPGTPPQGPPPPGASPQGPPPPGAPPQGPTLPGAPPQGPTLPGTPPQGPPLPESITMNQFKNPQNIGEQAHIEVGATQTLDHLSANKLPEEGDNAIVKSSSEDPRTSGLPDPPRQDLPPPRQGTTTTRNKEDTSNCDLSQTDGTTPDNVGKDEGSAASTSQQDSMTYNSQADAVLIRAQSESSRPSTACPDLRRKDSEAPVHVHQPKGSPVSHADPDSAISNGENHSKFVGSDQPRKQSYESGYDTKSEQNSANTQTVDLTLKVCFGEKKNDLFGQLEPINENMVMPFKEIVASPTDSQDLVKVPNQHNLRQGGTEQNTHSV